MIGLRMFSNSQRYNPLWSVVLSPSEFEVAYQLTHLLPDCNSDGLSAEGMTIEMLDGLIGLMDALKGPIERSDRLRIDVLDSSLEEHLSDPKSLVVDLDGTAKWEVVGALSKPVADAWAPALKFAITALGERETFLRTGYRPPDVNAVILIIENACFH